MASKSIIMYTTSWCADCIRVKKAFSDFHVPYEEVDIEKDAEAARIVEEQNNGMRSVPTIIFPDTSVLVEPSYGALEKKFNDLGYTVSSKQNSIP